MTEYKFNKVNRLTNQVISDIESDIFHGQLNVQQQQSKVILSKDNSSKVNNNLVMDKKLYEVIKKRKNLQEQIQRLKNDQIILKQKQGHPMKQSEQGKTKYFRSTATPQQKQKISKIIKQTNKFEREISKKNKQLQQKLKKLKQAQTLKKQEKIKELNELKKKTINQNLQNLKNRSIERMGEIEKSNKRLQKVLNEKILVKKLQEKWSDVEKQIQTERIKLLQKNKKERKYQPQKIQQHAKRYSQVFLMNQQKREQSLQKSKVNLLEQSRLANYGYSSFFNKINKDQEQKRQSSIQQQFKAKSRLQKRDIYAKTVKQKNKSQFKPKKSNPLPKVADSDIRTSKSLDNLGLNKLGNDYMKQIHSNIDEPNKKSTGKLPKINQTQKDAFKYPDYLTKARIQRTGKNPQQEPRQVRQLKILMASKIEDKRIVLEKAKALIERMQQKSANKNVDKVTSIMAKLEVINYFANEHH